MGAEELRMDIKSLLEQVVCSTVPGLHSKDGVWEQLNYYEWATNTNNQFHGRNTLLAFHCEGAASTDSKQEAITM
jgi:hypothetical protein